MIVNLQNLAIKTKKYSKLTQKPQKIKSQKTAGNKRKNSRK